MTAKRHQRVPATHSEAWLTLEVNQDSLGHMAVFVSREAAEIIKKLRRVTSHIASARLELANPKGVRELKAATTKMKGIAEPYERLNTSFNWMTVMLVTCVETYLHDLLCSAAKLDPQLMEKSEQALGYLDVVSSPSIETLCEDMRSRWAKNWLSTGSPTKWIERFERMGVRGIAKDVAPRLETIWGIRHTIVHRAGLAGVDFRSRHPSIGLSKDGRLQVSIEQFSSFASDVYTFLEPVENSFLARYPKLSATQTKVQTKAGSGLAIKHP